MWRSMPNAKSSIKWQTTQNQPNRNRKIKQQTKKRGWQVPGSTRTRGITEYDIRWKASLLINRDDTLDARKNCEIAA